MMSMPMAMTMVKRTTAGFRHGRDVPLQGPPPTKETFFCFSGGREGGGNGTGVETCGPPPGQIEAEDDDDDDDDDYDDDDDDDNLSTSACNAS